MAVIPRRVTIHGVQITVTQVPDLRDEEGDAVYGLTDVEEGYIKLSTTLNKSPDQLLRTYFHEYLHALFQISGHTCLLKRNHEEAIVRQFEYALFPLLDKSKLTS